MDFNEEQQIEQLKASLQKEVKDHEARLTSENLAYSETLIRQREEWLHLPRTQLLMFRAVIDFALITIRSLILVNGGAIIGILSFAGNLWGRSGNDAATTAVAIAPALTFFVVGLSCALLTAGCAYVSQACFVELAVPKGKRFGGYFRTVGVTFAFLSLLGFGLGAYASLTAFKTPLPAAVAQPRFTGIPVH